MLQLTNVSKKFGNLIAVDHIDLFIPPGELFGFLGPNGAGKTTTIKMIVGLYSLSSGSISVDGYDITKNQLEAKARIGYIPDQPFLYDKLTGREFLYFSGGLFGVAKSRLQQRIAELVEILKIEDWLDQRTEVYSQGMRQRISIASAFLHEPALIVIDEPMIGLDPQTAHIVKQFLRQQMTQGKTIFMSTHSLNVAEEICSRVGIINRGQIIFDDRITALQQLKSQKSHNFEQLFIELTAE